MNPCSLASESELMTTMFYDLMMFQTLGRYVYFFLWIKTTSEPTASYPESGIAAPAVFTCCLILSLLKPYDVDGSISPIHFLFFGHAARHVGS